VDTDSPVSFIKVNVLLKYIESVRDIVKTVETKLRNLNNEPLDIIGKTRIKITLFKLHKANHDIDLFILKNNTFEGDLILGRDFLTKEKLTLVYTPILQDDRECVDLFASLPLCIKENHTDFDLEQVINNNALDLGKEIQKIKSLLTDVNKETREIVNDTACRPFWFLAGNYWKL